MSELNHMQRDQLNRITAILTNMGCLYEIRLPDGSVVGGFPQPAKPERKRRGFKHPLGEMKAYYAPYIDNLLEGQFVSIPKDKYDLPDLQSSVASYCSRIWGNKTYTTSMNKATQSVDLIRTGGI